jgi:ABC-type iron transport system FetAB permease component
VLDVVLIALPIPVIWGLQLSVRRRLEAIALLSVGFMATAASYVRTYYIYELAKESTDYSWEVFLSYVASDVEINLGIVSARFSANPVYVNPHFLDLRVRTTYTSVGKAFCFIPEGTLQ